MTQEKYILIVEDDHFLSDIYKNAYQEEGFSTQVASDGEEALKCLEEKRPDLISLDLIMSGMNGFDFLQQLHDHKEWKNIPVLILSNLGQEEDKKRCLALVKGKYLVKTEVDIASLIKTIKEMI